MTSKLPKLLLAQKTPTGYTGTLPTLALTFLEEAESLFGPLAGDYMYCGVQVSAIENPSIWYPSSTTRKYVMVQVTEDSLSSFRSVVFELSHEMVHVLAPMGGQSTTNLEEGVAVWFSIQMTEKYAQDKEYAERSIAKTLYKHPCQLVTELLSIEPDAIVRLRKVQPVLGLIAKQDFEVAGLTSVPAALIDELVKPMIY